MKIFFDTEFWERGPEYPVMFISIGMVREDGQEYYAVSSEFDEESLSDWLKENVVPRLGDVERKPNSQIAEEIEQFVGDDPEFYADHCSYDWVVLSQLFGTMMDLPEGWPMYCNELQMLVKQAGIEDSAKPHNPNEHNALSDAIYDQELYEMFRMNKSTERIYNIRKASFV